MIKSIIQSFKKSWRLKKISKQLFGQKNKDITQFLTQQNDKDKALSDLLDLCKADENVNYLIGAYAVDEEKLKALFYKLYRTGAGQYVGGHFVAASSLCYAWTLKFLLDHFDGKNFSIKGRDDYNSSLFISNRLIKYFERGESGEVKY